jgi:hypothetical protein
VSKRHHNTPLIYSLDSMIRIALLYQKKGNPPIAFL